MELIPFKPIYTKLKTKAEKIFALTNVFKIVEQLNENQIFVCELNLEQVYLTKEKDGIKLILENDCISEIDSFSRRNRLLFESSEASVDCFCVSNLLKGFDFDVDFHSFHSIKQILDCKELNTQLTSFSNLSFQDFIKEYIQK